MAEDKPKKKWPHAGGRKTKFTPEVVRKLETAFSWGCSNVEAALYAGVGRTQLWEYEKTHPKFSERKELLKSRPTLAARQTVVKAVSGAPAQFDAAGNVIRAEVKADPEMAMKYLERKKKDEFSTKQVVDHEGLGKMSFTVIEAGEDPYIDDNEEEADGSEGEDDDGAGE